MSMDFDGDGDGDAWSSLLKGHPIFSSSTDTNLSRQLELYIDRGGYIPSRCCRPSQTRFYAPRSNSHRLQVRVIHCTSLLHP